ncbi:MAG: response regulator [Anaerolineae bacterium]|nr:response regulator [Anaerolineae bacterium]MBL6966611.1 response regulator [Anaerolineales bacterium]
MSMADRGKHILYIEDNAEMIDLVEIILGTKGYKVTGVLGGAEGWKSIQELLPDLVLLDLMMPDVDGWEVYQNIRDTETTQHIPVVVITAKAQQIDRVLAENVAGVQGYLPKPFKNVELLKLVQEVLGDPA